MAHGFDEALVFAAAGEERDATWRSIAQDLADAAAARRDGLGFVRATRPADLAKALGPRRRVGRRISGGRSWSNSLLRTISE